MQPPVAASNCVASFGRGATTRSDIGPARVAPDLLDFESVMLNTMRKIRRLMLLKSVIRTSPKGWIAAARLEEDTGKIRKARESIRKGCVEFQKNEDVWIEACQLVNPDEAKGVIANGVKAIPSSVRLWIQAARLEHEDYNKRRLLRMGLEKIPDSLRLWKALVELANEGDAKRLLQRAVECCPLHVELWLALARLEKYDAAKKVLRTGREKLPKERAIWIAEAKLDEAFGNTFMVGKIIERGIQALLREGVEIDREAWRKEAEAAEWAGYVWTCNAIISNTN